MKIGAKNRTKCPYAGSRTKLDWDQVKTAALEQIARSVTAIRAGRFPPEPLENACSYCPAQRACRFEKWRIQQKQRED